MAKNPDKPDRAVLWRAVSGQHNLYDGELLSSMLGHAEHLGLVGGISWVDIDNTGVTGLRVDESASIYLSTLLRNADQTAQDGLYCLRAGGTAPHWYLSTVIMPYDAANKWVSGFSSIALFLPGELLDSVVSNDELLQVFEAVHTPENTEYALIHPSAHYDELSDGPYDDPVTIGPMFRGVFWANYLGPGHIELFEKLDDINLAYAWWQNTKGLGFSLGFALSDVESVEAVKEAKRLTGLFRSKLLPD